MCRKAYEFTVLELVSSGLPGIPIWSVVNSQAADYLTLKFSVIYLRFLNLALKLNKLRLKKVETIAWEKTLSYYSIFLYTSAYRSHEAMVIIVIYTSGQAKPYILRNIQYVYTSIWSGQEAELCHLGYGLHCTCTVAIVQFVPKAHVLPSNELGWMKKLSEKENSWCQPLFNFIINRKTSMESSYARKSQLEARKRLKRHRYSRMSRDSCYHFVSWDMLHRISSLVMDLDCRATDKRVTEWHCKMRRAHSPTLEICILLLKSRDYESLLPQRNRPLERFNKSIL